MRIPRGCLYWLLFVLTALLIVGVVLSVSIQRAHAADPMEGITINLPDNPAYADVTYCLPDIMDRVKNTFHVEGGVWELTVMTKEEFHDKFPDAYSWVVGYAAPELGEAWLVLDMTESKHENCIIIAHELTHLLEAAIPGEVYETRWLAEGNALYLTGEMYEPERPFYWYWRRMLRTGYVLPFPTLDAALWSPDSGVSGCAYAEAGYMAQYLYEVYGAEAAYRLDVGYQQGLDTDRAFRAAFGIRPSEFATDWYYWMQAQRFYSGPRVGGAVE